MKILQVHNRYQQPGGEDAVVEAERALLEGAGLTVVRYERANDEIGPDWPSKLGAAANAFWSGRSVRDLTRLIARERPRVAHFHNTFPLISPAAYTACRRARVPIVQTLHNYRLVCPAATLYRAGQVCEDCVSGSLWSSVRFRCYRGSMLQSAAAAGALGFHQMRGSWQKDVDRFVALTEFARHKLVAAGLPANRITVKPNFLAHDPGARKASGESILYVGRLSEEKGLATLARVWKRLPRRVPLRIVGDGPLRASLERDLAGRADVSFLGRVPGDRVPGLLKEARALLVPSLWYEGFPMTVVEAFACGLPVVASKLGSLAEIVRHEENGLLIDPTDDKSWETAVLRMIDDPGASPRMGARARTAFEALYGPKRNLDRLLGIYAEVGARPHSRDRGSR